MAKHLPVSPDTHKKIMVLKAELGNSTVNETIQELLHVYKREQFKERKRNEKKSNG